MKVLIGERLVDVIIIRKNNKNIYFRYDSDLNLVVTASKRISEKYIKELIDKNIVSLNNMLKKSEKKQEKNDGLWYLGNKYDIVLNEEVNGVIWNQTRVITSDIKLLEKDLRKKMIDLFNERVSIVCDKFNKLPTFSLKIRKMKTRWGVCNYKRMTVTLNSELIKYRKDLIDYVIIHELCHFTYHDHSKDFWSLVSNYYPNYKEARKELRNQ